MSFHSAGGRKVASSNLAAPTTRKPAREAGFRHVGRSHDRPAKGSWYRPWYQTAGASSFLAALRDDGSPFVYWTGQLTGYPFPFQSSALAAPIVPPDSSPSRARQQRPR